MPPPPTTPAAPDTCPTSGTRCSPVRAHLGSWPTWTRPSTPARPGGRRPRRPPRPAHLPVQPRVIALRTRFERTGQLADLDAGRSRLQEAVAASPPGHSDRAAIPHEPRDRAGARFGRTGAAGGPGRRHHLSPQAVAATPAGHLYRPEYLSSLGDALRTRFGRTGQLADLDQAAIDADQEAADATPADHPDRRRNTCTTRRRAAGSVRAHRGSWPTWTRPSDRQEAIAVIPADHPDRAAMSSNLGNALQARFVRTGELTDLDEAIEPPGSGGRHPRRAPRPGRDVSNLGPRCGPGSGAPGHWRTWTRHHH